MRGFSAFKSLKAVQRWQQVKSALKVTRWRWRGFARPPTNVHFSPSLLLIYTCNKLHPAAINQIGKMSKYFTHNQTETVGRSVWENEIFPVLLRDVGSWNHIWDNGPGCQLLDVDHATLPDKRGRADASSSSLASWSLEETGWEDDGNDDDADGVGAQPALGYRLLARLLPRVQEQQELGHRWPV